MKSFYLIPFFLMLITGCTSSTFQTKDFYNSRFISITRSGGDLSLAVIERNTESNASSRVNIRLNRVDNNTFMGVFPPVLIKSNANGNLSRLTFVAIATRLPSDEFILTLVCDDYTVFTGSKIPMGIEMSIPINSTGFAKEL